MKSFISALALVWLLAACDASATPTPSAAPTLPATPTRVATTPTPSAAPSLPATPTRAAATPTPSDDGLPGRAVPDEGAEHVPISTVVIYKNYPPSSGKHYPQWLKYGVASQPIPEGYWIHNLEHGTVVALFKCPNNSCADRVAQMQRVFQTARPGKYGEVKLVAAPYDHMDHDFAVVAWDRVDEFDTFDQARILKFYEAFVDQGPEDVP